MCSPNYIRLDLHVNHSVLALNYVALTIGESKFSSFHYLLLIADLLLYYMFFLPDETQRRVEDGAGVRGAMLQVG